MRRITSFAQANQQLQAFVPPNVSDRKYSLTIMKQLMTYLDNPQDKIRVIHVAGTSGKTSTCYYIAAMLHGAGKKVGLTVSPHIDEINERVQINLQPLPETAFCKKLEQFLELVDKSKLKPSYFELLVAFAYWVFASEAVDYAVVEVGLGGLLDGTNVVTRSDKVCVITDIGLDHTNVLGNTLADIATQKAGIILDHSNVFMHEQDSTVMQAIRKVCAIKHGVLHIAQTDGAINTLPLFQRRNWLLAREAANYVVDNISSRVLALSANTIVPARMEIIERGGKIIVIDGSHNEQKLRALKDSLIEKFPSQPIVVLVSFGHNKEDTINDSLELLTSFVTHIVIAKFHMGQDEYRVAIEPAKLQQKCRELGFHDAFVEPNPEKALEVLLKRPEKILLVTGSFYLLNHIRPKLQTTS